MKAKILSALKKFSKSVGLYGPLSRVRYRFGDYQRALEAEKELYGPFVEPGQVVFDIGANVGRKTQAFLELGAKVVSFEPQPECAEEIRLRCGAQERLEVHECAIGAREGRAQLDVSQRSGLAKIVTNEATDKDTITVEIYPIDHFVHIYGMPAFCKIDVEGYELEVLEGFSRLPERFSFEYHANSAERADRVIKCLEYIRNRKSDVYINYTRRTGTDMQSEEWVRINEFMRNLERGWGSLPDFGDVFVFDG